MYCPTESAVRIMEEILEEVVEDGGFDLTDARDDGMLVRRGESVILRVGTHHPVMLTVLVPDEVLEEYDEEEE